VNLAARLLAAPDPDRPALSGTGSTTTYRQLDRIVARWRRALVAAGVTAGDRVVVIAGNEPRFVHAHLAILGLGAVSVPLNPEAPPPELQRQAVQVAPRLAVVGVGDPAPGVDLGCPRLGADLLDLAEGLGASSPERAGSPEEPDRIPVSEVELQQEAVLLFTSGTGGVPRPAVLTHGNLTASLDALRSHAAVLTERPHVVLVAVPLFHVFGLAAVLHLGLDLRSELVLLDRPTAARVVAGVAERSVTVLGGPPTLWRQLVDDSSLASDALSGLAVAVSGAAKLPVEVAMAVRERFGIVVVEGYGLTETAAAVASAVGTEAPVGSVGRLLPGVEARIVDPIGQDVLVGDPGELWVRGPVISPGYLTASEDPVPPGYPTSPGDPGPAARSEARSYEAVVGDDGWFSTGDIAVVDDHGNLTIVDRTRDLILVSGFNVYPGEVESVLRSHPAVADAGVVSRPDTRSGERVVAHVVPIEGAEPTSDELIDHCRHHLARYKVPAEVEIRDELPIGVVGKLQRRRLS
jgi:long-chain acyl-CoA synthetase